MRVLVPSLIFGIAVCSQAMGNAGATSAGVTTTVGNQNPNDPSPDVQAQSAGFVQQNQQLQNAQSPAAAVVPGGIAGQQAGGSQGTSAPAGGAAAAGGDANVDAAHPVVAVPPAPPPPPPTYESTMRRIDRHSENPPTSTVVSTPATTSASAPKPEPAPTPPPVVAPVAPPAAATSKAPVAVNAARASTATAEAPTERAAPAITGGRGAAPDGVTFYSGLTIAGALLAFGFFTFVRMGRNETSN